MLRMSQSNVLIIGLRGLGVEIGNLFLIIIIIIIKNFIYNKSFINQFKINKI